MTYRAEPITLRGGGTGAYIPDTAPQPKWVSWRGDYYRVGAELWRGKGRRLVLLERKPSLTAACRGLVRRALASSDPTRALAITLRAAIMHGEGESLAVSLKRAAEVVDEKHELVRRSYVLQAVDQVWTGELREVITAAV